MEPEEVVIKPILTEKSYRLQDEDNTYTFRVREDANKIQIREAVEKMFDVQVEDVRTMNQKGKTRSFRFQEGETPSIKKALVTLEPSYHIDLI
jgi:large subunit ribosomal protein L23